MRLAHLSDTHVQDGNRLDELAQVLDAFIEECRRARVDLVVHSGDVFHKKNNATEENVFADFVRRVAEIAPMVIVKGNHDSARDLEIFGKLETSKPVLVFERPGTIEIAGAGILATPWFDKAHLVATLAADIDQQQTNQLAIEAAKRLLITLSAQATAFKSRGLVPIHVAHILAAGSQTSTGQTLIGTTVELAIGDLLDVCAAYTALGHVHLTQVWGEGRIAYAGSPIRQNFGEPEPKGFRLVEIENESLRNDFVELPARKIELFEADLTDLTNSEATASLLQIPEHISGSMVRLRYRVRPQDMPFVDEAAIERALRAAGAHDVKIEAVVVQENRLRSELITVARTTIEKIEAYWEAKGINLDETTRARLIAKLESIEMPAAESAAA